MEKVYIFIHSELLETPCTVFQHYLCQLQCNIPVNFLFLALYRNLVFMITKILRKKKWKQERVTDLSITPFYLHSTKLLTCQFQKHYIGVFLLNMINHICD